MGPNRIFFPQDALDQWIGSGRVDFQEGHVIVQGEGRRYRVAESVRIIAEVTGGLDEYELVGRVKSVAYLTELGAELLGTSMIIGDLAYEVIPGFMGTPVGSFSEHRARSAPPPASAAPTSDEQLLAQYLMQTLE